MFPVFVEGGGVDFESDCLNSSVFLVVFFPATATEGLVGSTWMPPSPDSSVLCLAGTGDTVFFPSVP